MLLFRPLIHYADFEGRSHRGEYLQFMFAQALFAGVTTVLAVRLMASGGASIGVAVPILLGLVILAGAVLLIPNLALQVRRLHDTDRSARWMGLVLPGILAPIVIIDSSVKLLEQVTAGGSAEAAMTALIGTMSTAGLIWLVGSVCNMCLFVMLLMPGTAGSNLFGPDPRDEAIQNDQTPSVFDDAHLEILFAEARREARTAHANPGPVFRQDSVLMNQFQSAPPRTWRGDAPAHAVSSGRGFGRRGG